MQTVATDYQRIERAIAYLDGRASDQPSLAAVAAHVHLSPFHFQRLFRRWAGTTPKRFLQALTVEHGKRLLARSKSLLEVAHDVGLSGTSRLHDHFVQLEAVTPGEFKARGAGVTLTWGSHATPFGEMFLAATPRGVCRATFIDHADVDEELAALRDAWPHSTIRRSDASTGKLVDAMFNAGAGENSAPLSVHVSGTNFQVAVWRALLRIPPGAVTSYTDIAQEIGKPTASRAVGGAVGANPVAFAIPCHRVIQRSGAMGGYRWGVGRKRVMQAWEQVRVKP